MINFTKLEINNFGSYEHQIINFKAGKHLVSGINGCGKSTPWEALSYCIYKYMYRGKNPSRNHKGDCFVKLSFNIKNKEYRIERYFKDKTYKNSLKLLCEEEDISSDTIKNTENLILELGFPAQDLFIMTITVIQGLPINFSQLTNTNRKEILEVLFSFNVWEEFRKKAKKYNKIIQSKQNEVQVEFTNKREAMIALDSKLNTIQNIQGERVLEIDSEIVKIKNNIKENIKETNNLSEKLSKDEKLNIEVESLRTNLIKLNSRLSQNKSLVENQSCPTCKRSYPIESINDAKNMVTKIENKIKTVKEQYDNFKKILDQDNELSVLIQNLQNNINNYKNKIKDLADEKIKSQKTIDINLLQEELKTITEEVNKFKTNLQYINNELEFCNYIETLLLPSSTFRTNILVKYIQYINQIIEEIREYIFSNLKIKLQVDNRMNGIDIYLEKDGLTDYEYSMLSGGEKKRLDVIVILALQRFLLESSGISSNLIVFDEIFDSLDIAGIEGVLECLNYLYDEKTCVYIISHNLEIKGMFDNIINVEKTEGISQINLGE